MIRILVTGSRDFTYGEGLARVLSDVYSRYDDEMTIVHGGARGADRMAGYWARGMGADFRVFEEVWNADWEGEGRAAGPLRNKRMVAAGADLCIAFYKADSGNVGTSHCVREAKAAGIPVESYTQG